MADGDDNWFRLIGRGWEIVGQRLARTVAKDISIDNTAVIEYTEWVKLETFLGSMASFAGDKEQDAKKARKHTDGSSEMNFWIDSLKHQFRHTRTSVAWPDPQ